MARRVSVVIKASPGEVFDFVNDESNFFRLYPHWTEHRITERLQNGGHNCVQVFDFPSGTHVEGRSICLSFDPPRSMSHLGEVDAGGSWVQTLTFDDLSGRTRLSAELEINKRSRAVPRRLRLWLWLRHVRREFAGRTER